MMLLNLSSPFMLTAILASIALMIVNGWTDAPVNIAAAIHSKAITPKAAVLLAAVFNLLGAAAMCFWGNKIAVSIYSISGLATQGKAALPSLTAAISAVVVWALAALRFGIPTSESHSLAAALSGAAVATAGFGTFNIAEWLKLLTGLVLSTLPIALLSFLAVKYTENFFKNYDSLQFKRMQILGAALSSFSHGAQDGQKFAGVLSLNIALAQNNSSSVSVPFWATLVSASFIALGTLLGGRKIIDRFEEFAPKDPKAGFMSDLVSSIGLLFLSITGIPASTTHAKSSAVMGAGAIGAKLKTVLKSANPLFAAWGLTFPVSAALGYLFAVVFLRV